MRRTSFTLVELLVVIALIAFLTAILVPSLRNSREQAKTIRCGSNIRQLALGLAAYETENETFPPSFDDTLLESPPGGYAGDPSYDRTGWWWFNYTTHYSSKDTGRNSVIWCPSRQTEDSRLEENVLCGNYGVNQSVCKRSSGKTSHSEFIGRPLGSADISQPGETLSVVDSGYTIVTWWHATDVPPTPPGKTVEDAVYVPGLWINKQRHIWAGQEYDAINGRHPNKTVNVGFVDGHAGRKKADDLFVEKTSSGYNNLRPLWLPK
jgi:prepilin-type processing-associated H-X9-DG protein